MFMDYIRYFFTGYRTLNMAAFGVSIVGTLRYFVLFIVGTLANALSNQFAGGNFSLDFHTLAGYVMPAVIVILGYIWKLTREVINPVVPATAFKNLQAQLAGRGNAPQQMTSYPQSQPPNE